MGDSKFFKIVVPSIIAVIFSVFLYSLFSAPSVDAQHGKRTSISKAFVTDSYEEIIATSTNVVAITSGIIDTTRPDITQRAYIKVTGQGIRWLCTGDNPSTSLGNPASTGDWLQIIGLSDIQNFKIVNDDDTGTATCHVNLQSQGVMDQ